jgi:transcriptional regulator GlxA family with amidase domain
VVIFAAFGPAHQVWQAVADQLAEAYPSITVEADAIHVRDGKLRTAAGVTAGLGLALALAEEDLGARHCHESGKPARHVL